MTRIKSKATEERDGSADPVLRCDKLRHAMNPGKERRVLDLMRAWRKAGRTVSALQWRNFWATGNFDKLGDAATEHRKAYAKARKPILDAIVEHYGVHLPEPEKGKDGKPRRRMLPTPPGLVDPLAGVKDSLGAARTQMVQRQVVGLLESYMSNRMNDFTRAVMRSSLDDRTRHLLNAVNLARAWYDLKRTVRINVMRPDGTTAKEVVPHGVRRLARAMMRQILSRHRKPRMNHIGMVLDQREVTISASVHDTSFPLWLSMTTLVRGRDTRIAIPLLTYPRFDEREGERKLTVQVSRDRETGQLSFGIVTDISKACEKSREKYLESVRTDVLALDFGLCTLFGTDRGDLFGRGFLTKLKSLDQTLSGIARHVQREGRKPRTSKRYREQVDRVRGFVETEVNRVLNRLVKVRRPRELVLESLNFRSPELSKRMNRIVQNCGRGVIQRKIKALSQELGIESHEVNPAYTSQECSCCHYVDKRNRRTRDRFACLWCGRKLHADVNGARTARGRRSSPLGTGYWTKAAILETLRDGHLERWPEAKAKGRNGRLGAPADPRLSNPHFRGWNGAGEVPLGGVEAVEEFMRVAAAEQA